MVVQDHFTSWQPCLPSASTSPSLTPFFTSADWTHSKLARCWIAPDGVNSKATSSGSHEVLSISFVPSMTSASAGLIHFSSSCNTPSGCHCRPWDSVSHMVTARVLDEGCTEFKHRQSCSGEATAERRSTQLERLHYISQSFKKQQHLLPFKITDSNGCRIIFRSSDYKNSVSYINMLTWDCWHGSRWIRRTLAINREDNIIQSNITCVTISNDTFKRHL